MNEIEVGSCVRILKSEQGFEVGSIHRVTRISGNGKIVNLINIKGLSSHPRCNFSSCSYQEYTHNCEYTELSVGSIDEFTGYRSVKPYEKA